MTVAAAQTNITALKALYTPYIAQITDDVAATQALLQGSATVALDMWENAKLAAANVAASAMGSYSNGVGVSGTKRATDKAEADASRYLDEFKDILNLGGVDLPTITPGDVALWSLRGAGY